MLGTPPKEGITLPGSTEVEPPLPRRGFKNAGNLSGVFEYIKLKV
jgi:hypothetical protein